MTAKTETHGPDGKLLAMTHRHCVTGKKVRIVLGPIEHLTYKSVANYVLADEDGNLSWASKPYFEESFSYIPGGQ